MESLKTLFFKTSYPFYIAIALNFVVHFPFMNEPPQSVHTWRQCNTLAVARNFYEEDMNILHTRVDNRGITDGITGSHFPLYEYILASFYQVLGEQFWIHRYLSFLLFLFGGIGIYQLFRKLFEAEIIARTGFISYLFAPELFYHQINALPDILSLSFSIWGFYLFIRWLDSQKKDYLILLFASIFTVLAGLTKLQYLAIGFPITVYFIANIRRYDSRKIVTAIAYGLISVIIPVSWYLRASYIIKQSGLTDFGIEFRPEDSLVNAITTLQKNIISELPETILNFGSFILLIIGLIYIFISKPFKHKWFLSFLVYALALIAYHIIELKQMEHHGYYMMPYYPVLLVLVGYGAVFLYRKTQYILLILLLLSQPILASIRIVPSRWMKEKKGYYPQVLYNENTRNELSRIVPNSSLCIVGPDESGCILFYLLHKKGFGFHNIHDLVVPPNGQDGIEDMILKGAQYIYLVKQHNNGIALLEPYIDTVLFDTEEITVASLKKQQ